LERRKGRNARPVPKSMGYSPEGLGEKYNLDVGKLQKGEKVAQLRSAQKEERKKFCCRKDPVC